MSEEREQNQFGSDAEKVCGSGMARPVSPDVRPAIGSDDVTLLLQSPTPQSINRLLELVYEQLRSAAQIQIEGERHAGAGHTLSATALVHEAYLKLVGPREIPWANRAHFYAAAADAMRRILIDRARAKYGRGNSSDSPRARRAALSLSGMESIVASEASEEGLLPFDDALSRLEAVDSQAASIVRLRFFAGLSVEEAALALGISDRTVKRDWAFARAWLRTELAGEDAAQESL